jgi:hypothetical protein
MLVSRVFVMLAWRGVSTGWSRMAEWMRYLRDWVECRENHATRPNILFGALRGFRGEFAGRGSRA